MLNSKITNRFIEGIKKILLVGFLVNPFWNLVYADGYILTDLGTTEERYSFASAINNNGIVVGTVNNGLGVKAFRFNGTREIIVDGSSQAFGINDNDIIVGRSLINGFIYTNNSINILSDVESAYAVNDLNQVVGYARNSSGSFAFIYENNSLINIGELLNANTSSASSINDQGTVIGNSSGRSFLYQNGSAIWLDYFNGLFNVAKDINNSNQIVGYARGTDGQWDAFILLNGVVTYFDVDGKSTFVNAINDNGVIVGSYQDGFISTDRAAILIDQQGTILDLNAVTTTGDVFDKLIKANDINNTGQIVGSGLVNGVEHAFLLSPEPCMKKHVNGESKDKEKKCVGRWDR